MTFFSLRKLFGNIFVSFYISLSKSLFSDGALFISGWYMTSLKENLAVALMFFNTNLGGLFRRSFWEEGVGGITPCLKLVRFMLETWNLARKYAIICSFRKYTFLYQGTLNLADVSIFCKNQGFLVKKVPLLKAIV